MAQKIVLESQHYDMIDGILYNENPNHPYHGSYRTTQTNAGVQLIKHPSAPSIFVAIGQLCKCYPEQTDDCWIGHKKRVHKKKSSKKSASDSTVDQPGEPGPVTHVPLT